MTHSLSAIVRRWLPLAAAAIVMCVAVPAEGAIDVELTELRSAEGPFDLNRARFTSTPDGRIVVWATAGEQANPVCSVAVIDDGATRYDYSLGDPTSCTDVLPHPDGGFFLRVMQADAREGDPAGATVRVDASGSELWSLSDQALVDANPEVDGGTGEFIGEYVGPARQMAYSGRFDKLIAFTTGVLDVGGGAPITQAHVVDTDDGELRVSGQTFGDDRGGQLAALTTRSTDGYFVLAFYRSAASGVNFYSYNARSSIDFFEPLGEQWGERSVQAIRYDSNDRFYILWLDSGTDPATTNVTVSDSEENKLWAARLDPSATIGGEPMELGAARGFWVGSSYVVVLYATDAGLLLRFVDVQTGEILGIASLNELTDQDPLAIVNGEEGRLSLIVHDTDNSLEFGRIVEYRLDATEVSDPGGDAGSDAGVDDAGDGDGGGGGAGGCQCGVGASPMPTTPAAAVAMIGVLGMMWWRRRRR